MTEHAHHTTHHHKQHDENGLAIASFVLGIVSLTGFGALTGIPAIITGAMSRKNPTNRGLGIAGLVLGIVSTALSVLIILIFIVAIILAVVVEESTTSSPQSDNKTSGHSRSI